MKRSFSAFLALSVGLAMVLGGQLVSSAIAQEKTPPSADAAVERAKREVRMLDDIYKT